MRLAAGVRVDISSCRVKMSTLTPAGDQTPGSSTVTQVPFPGSLSIVIRPPCRSTMDFAMERPRPAPPESRDRAGSVR